MKLGEIEAELRVFGKESSIVSRESLDQSLFIELLSSVGILLHEEEHLILLDV